MIARGQVLEIETGPERTTLNNRINNNRHPQSQLFQAFYVCELIITLTGRHLLKSPFFRWGN